MAQFNVTIGKETVPVVILVADIVKVIYKGQEALLQPTEEGWKEIGSNLSPAQVKAIGKAIEKHLK